MAYSVIRTDSFESDLDHILDHLVNTLKSSSGAKRLMKDLTNISSILEETPFIGAVSKKRFLSARSLREHFFLSYALIYRVDEDKVILVDLFHQTQDYNSQRYWDD